MRRIIDIVLAAIALTTAFPLSSPCRSSYLILLAGICLWFLSPIVAHADAGQSLRLRSGQACPRVVINEVVTDPQQDWNDSAGGDGIPFNATPGTGSTTSSDEWVELLNVSNQVFDLTGWQLIMIDTTPVTETLGAGTAVLRFSPGGSLSHFQPGERLIIGNPRGAMNNDVYLQLLDADGNLVDDVEIGDDFEEDGIDGAPSPAKTAMPAAPTTKLSPVRPMASTPTTTSPTSRGSAPPSGAPTGGAA